MRKSLNRSTLAIFASAGLVVAACGSDGDDTSEEPPAVEDDAPAEAEDTESPVAADEAAGDDADAEADQAPAQADEASTEVPTIVVTTNVLGDVVEEVVGDAAEVVTLMPVGADPHGFQASAQEVDTLMSADALIVNGAALEESLLDVIEAAEDDGVPTFEAISAVETIEFGEGGHDDHGHGDEHSDEEKDEDHGDEHSDEEHGDEEHSDEEHSKDDHGDEEHSDDEHSDEQHSDEEHGDDHDHSGDDPHFWTDPMQMAAAVDGIVDFLQTTVEFADPSAVDASADAYLAELTTLNDEIAAIVASIPEENRILVTNHQVFGYFANSFGFEQVGSVIPSGSTLDTTSGGELAELAEVVEAEGVPAVFTDNTVSDELAQTLADEVGGLLVIELYSGSLGEPDSDGGNYLDMQRTNAERISAALA